MFQEKGIQGSGWFPKKNLSEEKKDRSISRLICMP